MTLVTFLTFVAVLAVPTAAGALLARTLRRALKRPLRIPWAIGAGVLTAVLITLPWLAHIHLFALWDTLTLAAEVSLGFALTARPNWENARGILVSVASLMIGLLVLELVVRLVMPHPPGMATTPPNLTIDQSIRDHQSRVEGMDYGRRYVCAIEYPGQWDLSWSSHDMRMIGDRRSGDVLLPATYKPAKTTRHVVLHLGDSMTFGEHTPVDKTFTAVLNRLEPGVLHINAGISATGPDAYLVVMHKWLQAVRPDVVVMHIFAGNDLADLDAPYQCCAWGALLTYDGTGAHERCPTVQRTNLLADATRSYLYVSPAPFVVRALIQESRLAAWTMVALSRLSHQEPPSLPLQRLPHLKTILQTAQRELAAKGIPFVVDVLPERDRLERTPQERSDEDKAILGTARELGIPVLDPWPMLSDAVAHGETLFGAPGDPHFVEKGHELLANWLHAQTLRPVISDP